MSSFKLYNDEGLVDSLQFNDRIVAHYTLTSPGLLAFRSIRTPTGVNRVHLYAEEEGDYRVQVWQYMGTLDTVSATVTALSHSSFLCWAPFVVFSSTCAFTAETKFPIISENVPVSMSFGVLWATTSSVGTGQLTFRDTCAVLDGGYVYLNYSVVTNKLCSSVPLLDIRYSATNTPYSNFYVYAKGNTDQKIEVYLAIESGRGTTYPG